MQRLTREMSTIPFILSHRFNPSSLPLHPATHDNPSSSSELQGRWTQDPLLRGGGGAHATLQCIRKRELNVSALPQCDKVPRSAMVRVRFVAKRAYFNARVAWSCLTCHERRSVAFAAKTSYSVILCGMAPRATQMSS